MYLLTLLISSSGDVQVNPGPIVSGSVEPVSEVGSIYVVLVRAMLHGKDMQCFVRRAVSGSTLTAKINVALLSSPC